MIVRCRLKIVVSPKIVLRL